MVIQSPSRSSNAIPDRSAVPQTVMPGWYRDPSGRHELRYAGATSWTNTVCDKGTVTVDGFPAPPAAAKPRRLRWWVVAGIVVACMLGLGVVAIGLQQTVHTMDTYTADLTQDTGDFRSVDNAGVTLAYSADGYHLVDKSPGLIASWVKAPSSHTVIAAELTVRGVTVPAGAGFGPGVLNADGTGYGLTVDNAGTATLVEIDSTGLARDITSAKAPALSAGTTHKLMLTCAIDGRVRLAGYVDGAPVVNGIWQSAIASVSYTGMAGVATNVPAEWVGTHFARLGPDDMPPNAGNPVGTGR